MPKKIPLSLPERANIVTQLVATMIERFDWSDLCKDTKQIVGLCGRIADEIIEECERTH
jgi:hypothetical protein